MFKNKFIKILSSLICGVLLCVSTAFADATWSTKTMEFVPTSDVCYTNATFTSDVSEATEIPTRDFWGGVLYQWEILCTEDDSVVLTLYNGDLQIDQITLTSATSGDWNIFNKHYFVGDTMSYTFTGISSGTCYMGLVLWRK